MKISEGIEAVGYSLLLDRRILVFSDTQIGYEDSLIKRGVMIPKTQFKDMMALLSRTISKTNPNKVVIAGDIKHEFGSINKSEWNDTLEMLDYIRSKSELVIIKGNHDTILEPIVRQRGLNIIDYMMIGDTYICHGHRIPDEDDPDFKKSKTVIIGHEHPALGLRDSGRKEKYKCFLKGSFLDKELIVLPSFNTLTEGTDVLSEPLLSPFLSHIDDFEAYIVSDVDILDFGKIRDIKKKLFQ